MKENNMTDEAQNTLLNVVSDVLQRFAFMFAEAPENPDQIWQGTYLHSTIAFRGPGSGTISLMAPEPLCTDSAANILGVMDTSDLTPDAGEDAIKELSNVICGEFVSILYGSKVIVDLTVPVLCRTDSSKWREMAADSRSFIRDVEGQPMLVSLILAD